MSIRALNPPPPPPPEADYGPGLGLGLGSLFPPSGGANAKRQAPPAHTAASPSATSSLLPEKMYEQNAVDAHSSAPAGFNHGARSGFEIRSPVPVAGGGRGRKQEEHTTQLSSRLNQKHSTQFSSRRRRSEVADRALHHGGGAEVQVGGVVEGWLDASVLVSSGLGESRRGGVGPRGEPRAEWEGEDVSEVDGVGWMRVQSQSQRGAQRSSRPPGGPQDRAHEPSGIPSSNSSHSNSAHSPEPGAGVRRPGGGSRAAPARTETGRGMEGRGGWVEGKGRETDVPSVMPSMYGHETETLRWWQEEGAAGGGGAVGMQPLPGDLDSATMTDMTGEELLRHYSELVLPGDAASPEPVVDLGFSVQGLVSCCQVTLRALNP
jgi:hypothetical protein